MKKYLLKLIDNDIKYQKRCLLIAESTLLRFPDNQYWQRRKISLENKINAAFEYRKKVMNLK